MEKDSAKKKVKKISKSAKNIKFFESYLDFYNKNFRKKHILVYILALILFFIVLSSSIASYDSTASIGEKLINSAQNVVKPNVFSTIFKQNIPYIALVIFAGITPYIYLPAIGFLFPYILAVDIAEVFTMTSHTGNLIFMTLGAIIQIFAAALSIVTGFHYCYLSTKKFRYSQGSSFGIYDLKRQLYNISKAPEKLEKLNEEKQNKDIKREELNVKIPYRMLFDSLIIGSVLSVIGALIYAI